MKNFKTVALGMIFLFGLTAMSNITKNEGTTNETVVGEIPCSTVYTVCDNANPDDYGYFLLCVQRNGCGG